MPATTTEEITDRVRAPEPAEPPPGRRGGAQPLLLLVGSVLLAVYLLGLDADALLRAVVRFPIATAGAIVALNVMPGIVKTIRWRWLLRSSGIETPFGRAYLAINASFFLGLVTPGTAGELARALSVPDSRGRGLVIVTFEKIVDLIALLALAAASAVAVFYDGAVVWVTIAVGVTIAALSYWLLLRHGGGTARALLDRAATVLPASLRDRLRQGLGGLGTLAARPGTFLGSALGSLILWLVPFVQMWLIFDGLGLDAPLSLIAGSYFLPYLVGILSMIPLGIGSFDLSLSAVFGRYGVGGAEVALTPLLYRVLVSLPLIAFGYLCQVGLTRLARGERTWS